MPGKRKVWLYAVGALLLLALIAGGVWWLLHRVGDVRPALLPPKPHQASVPAKSPNTAPNVAGLRAPPDFYIGSFADNLGQVRDLQFSPGGTLLASVMKQGQVIALSDTNGDGRADQTKVILKGLKDPHGLAFHDGQLFVAELNRVIRYNWDESALTAAPDRQILDLPGSSDHITRSLLFVGDKLLVSLGSTCNICTDANPRRAAVIQTDADGHNPRIFAKGLRNGVFLALRQNEVWTGDNGRDYLGDNLPPDELDRLTDGSDYGWPFCYGSRIPDPYFKPAAKCASTLPPTFDIQAHSAPLGLVPVDSAQFPADWQDDLLVSYHGSWNRSVPTGYKVVRIRFQNGQPVAQEDFITGFLQGSQAVGRPVDLTFDKTGALYLSDDKSGTVYKITKR